MRSKKGFFDILFVLIILLLFLPTSSSINKSRIVNSHISEIDSVALIADSIIVDALADQSYNYGACVFSNLAVYNSKVESYLNNFESQRQDYFGSVCTYSISGITTLRSVDSTTKKYAGSLDITCVKENSIVNSSLSKSLKFIKLISITKPEINICNIKIIDDYESYTQLDQNQSI